MPAVERVETFEVPRQAFYDVVADYESYPQFVDNLVYAKVLEEDKKRTRAEFKVHLIRDIHYVLDIYHDEPKRVWWELVESPIFKVSSGEWLLKYKGKQKTEVHYSVEVIPKIFAPQRIIDMLSKQGLPKMMHAFAEEAAARARK